MQVVKELKGGELLYPPNIPSERGNTAILSQILIVVALLAVSAYLSSKNWDIVSYVKYCYYSTAINMSLLILCSFIWRISNLFEELRHIHARYDDRASEVFKSALLPNALSTIIIVLSISSLIGMTTVFGNPLNYLQFYGFKPYFFSLIASVILIRLIDIDESKLDTALELHRLKGLDYGSGMAYNYFYGYLNIVLPSVGDESKGLRENIEQYEAVHNVSVPVKKLFILIPTSLRIPPDLSEDSDGWLERVAKLDSVIKTRAGTLRRMYHNTVYKIRPGDQGQQNSPVYVITEGATPLLTFYEVLQHSGRDSTCYNDYKLEVVGSFYKTLRRIIKSKPECRDLCELVYYEDIDPAQKKMNVGKILYDIIQEQTTPSL